jgi:DNA-binding transcriptional ArsR family regulator
MTETATQRRNNKTSQAEQPANSAERNTFPSRAGMTPDYEIMAWRLGAVGHPDKLRIVELMRNGVKVLSPKEIALALDISLGVASYHIRFMVERDLLDLERVEPKRGALQHFYRLSAHGIDVQKILRL